MDTARLQIRRIAGWLAVLLWMGLIFFFSSQDATASTHSSESVLDFLLHIFRMDETEPPDDTTFLHFLLRKGAHFTVFAVLGLLLYNVIHQYPRADRAQQIGIPLALGVVYACVDELHQYFVPGRACQIRDVGIDTLGVIFGVVLGFLFVLLHRMRKEKSRESRTDE